MTKEEKTAYNKVNYAVNKEKIKARVKLYALSHKSVRNKANSRYIARRKTVDLAFKLLCNLRTRLYKAIKSQGVYKCSDTLKLVGCSPEQLKKHIESQFEKHSGMTWSNYGEWEIDHIKPCASFNLSIPEEQMKCFHYTNLQPLWEIDNQLKSDN